MVPATLYLIYNSYHKETHLHTISLPIVLYMENTQAFCPVSDFMQILMSPLRM